AELEGREGGTLIARPRLIDPNMQRDARVMRPVDRRKRRSPIDAGEPARIAMRENVDALALLLLGMGLDDAKPMFADQPASLDIGVADLGCLRVSRDAAALARLVAQGGAHLVERPTQIDCRGTCGEQGVVGAV